MSEDSYMALKQSEMEFRALFEQMVLGVSKVDVRTGRLVLVNQRFADLLGYAREELLALDLQTITHPDDRATVHQHMQELASSQVSSYAMVRRYVRKDGGVVWVNVTVSRLWSEGDEPDFAITTVEDVTERKLAEERTQSLLKQVQADKDLQDRLLSNMSDEVWFADTTGHFTLANPSACRAFALENIGNTDVQRFAEGLQVFRPDGSPRPVEEAPPLRALAGETVTNQEEIVRLPLSGELRYRQVNSSPMRDAQGTIIGCVSVVRDITERKRAEEALASCEQFLSSILEQGPASMWISDSEGTLIRMNQACRQLFGITDEEGVGKYNLLKDNLIEAQGFMDLVRDVFKKREIARFTIDYDVRRVEPIEVQGATHRILDVVISPIKDVSGKVTNLLVQHNDITERKRAETEIQDAREYAENIVETMREPLLVLDSDLKILTANHNFYDTFRGTPQATVGTFIYDLGNGQWDVPELRVLLEKILPEETVFNGYEVEHDFPDIGRKTMVLNARQIYRKEIGSHLILLAMEDITERKRAEEEIRTLNAELQERARRRIAELSAANKELEAFSYSVSHDLRSPLRSIDGFSQAFLEDYGSLVPEEGREDLERVRRATQSMGQLIDDMLFLSRVTRSQMHLQETDLSAVAAEVAVDLARENHQRDVQITIEPGMIAMGDPQLLRIVMANLLDNAWKFTSKGEHAHVSVGTMQDPEHGRAFFVRDDGVGFDPRYKSKLFVAFQRLHGQQEFPGTGIGLATVARAVRRHGGEVWAEGEVDRGATFYFTIPDLHTSIPAKEEQP